MKNSFAVLFCFALAACGSSGGVPGANINYLRDLPTMNTDTVNTSNARFSGSANVGGRLIRRDNNRVYYIRQTATGNSMSPDTQAVTQFYDFTTATSRDGSLTSSNDRLKIYKYEQTSGGFHFITPSAMTDGNFNLLLVVPYISENISATPYMTKPTMQQVNYVGDYAIAHPPGTGSFDSNSNNLHEGRFSLNVNFMANTISGTAMNGTRQVGTFDMGEFRQGEFSLPIDPDPETNQGRSPEFNELVNMTDLSFRMRFIGGENTDLDGIEFRDIRGLFLGIEADGLIAAGRSFGRKTPINNERTFHWVIGLAGEKWSGEKSQ